VLKKWEALQLPQNFKQRSFLGLFHRQNFLLDTMTLCPMGQNVF